VVFNREQSTAGDSLAPSRVTETTEQSEHSPASSHFNFRKRPWLVSLKCRYRTSSNKMSNEIDIERDDEVEVVSKTCISAWPGACFSKAPETFRARKGHSKILNLAITELFYSHIPKMNWGSLHTRSFRRIHFSVFRYRLTKNGFTGPKSFRCFRETGPRSGRAARLFVPHGLDVGGQRYFMAIFQLHLQRKSVDSYHLPSVR